MISGKIYKIVNSKTDHVYFGSTERKIEERLNSFLCRPRNDKTKALLRELGRDCFNVIHIEDFVCPSLEELHKREDEYIDAFAEKSPLLSLNNNRAHRTPEQRKKKAHEYYLKNRQYIYKQTRNRITATPERHEEYKSYMRQYSQDNKDRRREREKKRREDNPQLIVAEREKNKKNYEEKKDDIIRKQEERHALDREKGLTRCEPCDKTLSTKASYKRHLKSKSHLSKTQS